MAGKNGYSNRLSIYQTATNTAATLAAAGVTDLATFRALRDEIVKDLDTIRAEEEVAAEAAVTNAPTYTPYAGANVTSGGSGGKKADPAGVTFGSQFKQVAGLTVAQAWDKNPGYVVWAAEKMKPDQRTGQPKYMAKICQEFLATIPPEVREAKLAEAKAATQASGNFAPQF